MKEGWHNDIMQDCTLIAHGSMGMTDEDWNLMLFSVLVWIAGLILLIPNFYFILKLRTQMWAHLLFFAFYVGFALAVIAGAFVDFSVMVPLLVIGHFAALLLVRKDERNNHT